MKSVQIVAVVAVTVIAGDETDQQPLAAAVSDARADRDSQFAQLANADGVVGAEAIIDQDGHGFLLGEGLPALASDQTYQLWGVIGEQVISLGVLGTNPEIELFSSGGEPVSQLVVTIEPGIYFIDLLLQEARSGPNGRRIRWDVVERLRPYGGIRIEDDVACTTGTPENLTRDAFAGITSSADRGSR